MYLYLYLISTYLFEVSNINHLSFSLPFKTLSSFIKLKIKSKNINWNGRKKGQTRISSMPTFFYCFSSLLHSCLERMKCYKLNGLYEDKKGGTTICMGWNRVIIRQWILNFSIKHRNLVLKRILWRKNTNMTRIHVREELHQQLSDLWNYLISSNSISRESYYTTIASCGVKSTRAERDHQTTTTDIYTTSISYNQPGNCPIIFPVWQLT